MEMTDHEALCRLHDLTQDLENRLKELGERILHANVSGLFVSCKDIESLRNLTNRLYYSDE